MRKLPGMARVLRLCGLVAAAKFGSHSCTIRCGAFRVAWDRQGGPALPACDRDRALSSTGRVLAGFSPPLARVRSMISRQDVPAAQRGPRGDLAAIRHEFSTDGIGPLMLAEVRDLARQIAPRYNASVYSEIGNWRHGLDDLVQDVVADSLLRDQQAQYLVAASATIDDFRRLLARQVRRCLARRRVRTVIDNLLDRARPMLDGVPFVRGERHLYPTFTLAGALKEERAATFRELRSAAAAVRRLPQAGPSNRDRAPVVFTGPQLHAVLVRIAEVVPVAFTIGELDRVLRLTLPHLLPGVLDPSDPHEHHDGVRVVDDDLVASSVAELLRRLTDEHLFAAASKLAGASDIEVATRLGVSRRTATNRKLAAFVVIEEVLFPLSPWERRASLDRLRPALQDALLQM